MVLVQNLENAIAQKRYPVAMQAAKWLSKSKRQQGKLSESLDYLMQYQAFADSIFNKEKEKIVQEAAFKYEKREKQAEIDALKLQQEYTRQRNGWAASQKC